VRALTCGSAPPRISSPPCRTIGTGSNYAAVCERHQGEGEGVGACVRKAAPLRRSHKQLEEGGELGLMQTPMRGGQHAHVEELASTHGVRPEQRVPRIIKDLQ